MTADELRLKVSLADYDSQEQKLSGKIHELEGIVAEYDALMQRATDIFGDSDTNYANLQAVVKENIRQVKKELSLLNESKAMLEKQRQELESLNTGVETMFTNVKETVKSTFETIKLAEDLVG